MKKNSIKNTRINGEVQRVLAEIIRNIDKVAIDSGETEIQQETD